MEIIPFSTSIFVLLAAFPIVLLYRNYYEFITLLSEAIRHFHIITIHSVDCVP